MHLSIFGVIVALAILSESLSFQISSISITRLSRSTNIHCSSTTTSISVSKPPIHNGQIFELQVLYEDNDVAVVFKPAGMPCYGRGRKTLLYALPYALKASDAVDALESGPHHCHRLDMPTSGLVVCGKTSSSMRGMQEAFEKR
jgi:23S rRNA-/tRNA-specific pseudouridylate synthase